MSKNINKYENIIFFDGVCNLCNSVVDFFILRDKEKKFYFSSLQSDFAREFLKDKRVDIDQLETIYFYADGRLLKKHKAVVKALSKISWKYSFFSLFFYVPKFIGYPFYNLIAKRRYSMFGKRDTCRVASSDEKARFLE